MKHRVILSVLISFSLFACRPEDGVQTPMSKDAVSLEVVQFEKNTGDSVWVQWEQQLRRLLRTHEANTGQLVAQMDVEKRGVTELAAAHLNALEQLLAEYRLIHGELNADIWDERRRYAQLEREFEKQRVELRRLQLEIESMVQRINTAEITIDDSRRINDLLNEELNRVYFAFGTAAELEKADVVKVRSGWWTGAARVKLKKNLNTDYLSPGDQRHLKELLLFSNNAVLLTPHPTDSFEMKTVDSGAKLVITDSEKFWKLSRYLAVQVD